MEELQGMGYNVIPMRRRLVEMAEVMDEFKKWKLEIVTLKNKAEDHRMERSKLQSMVLSLQVRAEREGKSMVRLLGEVDHMEKALPNSHPLFHVHALLLCVQRRSPHNASASATTSSASTTTTSTGSTSAATSTPPATSTGSASAKVLVAAARIVATSMTKAVVATRFDAKRSKRLRRRSRGAFLLKTNPKPVFIPGEDFAF
ncbi:hypothetical protein SESBI_43868 [Sesbania bispinosa]|nr:hypothetical protein SESBI_43868 [Sesbania bispinosa]